MPELVLAILKYLFLLLIFLFLARAVRAMYLEIAGPRTTRSRKPEASARERPAKVPERVTVIPSDGAKARTFNIEEELLIGRGEKCHIVLNDSYVSQVHARIYKRDEGFFVEDMGSTNGTYLNRKKVNSPTPLARGDRLKIGKTQIELKR